MKKRIMIAAMALFALALTACGKPNKPVEGFMEAAKAYDFEAMQGYVKSDEESIKEKVDSDNSQAYLDDYWSKQASTISYKITDAVIDGNSATVKVNVNYSDCSKIVQEAMADYMKQGMKLAMSEEETTDEQYSEMFKSIFLLKCANMPPENATVDLEFKCEKIDGKWIITNIPGDMLNVITCDMLKAFSE